MAERLTEAQVSRAITKDLIKKLSDDVGSVIRRTLSIAPEPHLPIAIAAGVSAVAVIAALLDTNPGPEPDKECLLLAGLLLGNIGPDAVETAFRDFELIKSARRALQSGGDE